MLKVAILSVTVRSVVAPKDRALRYTCIKVTVLYYHRCINTLLCPFIFHRYLYIRSRIHKTFFIRTYEWPNKLGCFSLASLSRLVWYLQGRPVSTLSGARLKGRFLAINWQSIQHWKVLPRINSLAYLAIFKLESKKICKYSPKTFKVIINYSSLV